MDLAEVKADILIDAPIERVFARIARHDRCEDWLVFVTQASYTTQQTSGAGTAAHHRGEVAGRKMEWDGEIVEWVKNEKIVWRATSGTPKKMKMIAVNRVTPEDGKSRYGLKISYEMPYGFLGRFMDAILVGRRVRDAIEKSLERLKAVVEGE